MYVYVLTPIWMYKLGVRQWCVCVCVCGWVEYCQMLRKMLIVSHGTFSVLRVRVTDFI